MRSPSKFTPIQIYPIPISWQSLLSGVGQLVIKIIKISYYEAQLCVSSHTPKKRTDSLGFILFKIPRVGNIEIFSTLHFLNLNFCICFVNVEC